MTCNPNRAYFSFYTAIGISFLATLLIIGYLTSQKYNFIKISVATTVFSDGCSVTSEQSSMISKQ